MKDIKPVLVILGLTAIEYPLVLLVHNNPGNNLLKWSVFVIGFIADSSYILFRGHKTKY